MIFLAPAFAAGTYIRVAPPPKVELAPSSNIIYLKRCPLGGCGVHAGSDDSRTQTSSIAMGSVVIGGFSQGSDVWDQMVQCVKDTYAPYDVVVTDVDPGSQVPHYENIVGGKPSDLRDDIPNAGGVAPFDCQEIPNGISYTFDVYGPDALTLCWTASQETAHVFGLEHELLQEDPMTYLGEDLPKRFRDVDAGCGEYAPRACQCGRTTQNSYRMIVGMFGPGAPTPPTVMFTSPADGKTVQPGFGIDVAATDDVRVDHVELYIDGAMAGSSATPPYVFTAPDLALGPHMLEARAIDVQGTPASAMISVTSVPPCTQTKGCDGTDVCVSGLCVPGPKQPGGLGSICQQDEECLSMSCGDGGEPLKHCVEPCDTSAKGACPIGFECLAAGSGGVCWPAPAGGCCDAGGSPSAPALLGALLVLVLRRRR